MASPESHDSFDDDFRRHFQETYGGASASYGDYAHAYRFGRTRALEGGFIGLTFERAAESLRALYETAHPDRSFADVRAAVEHGFGRGQSLKPQETGGLDRTTRQHSGRREPAEGTSAHTAVGSPPQEEPDRS